MNSQRDSTRILRTAAWIWIGYLFAMALMDLVLYTPQVSRMLVQNPPTQEPIPLLNDGQLRPPGGRLTPIYLFYAANGFVALAFLVFTHWSWIQGRLGRAYH